mmetsp:Transcript_19029/g.39085  ORF Transcript_19029/g.39085 Transcript_19029/m.39085 type:complete len:419 (+) Transcript_19029:81-1337(+)|eukprot:CAMPEP_0201123678 /NCGR_PEP_ID=MMETSP0850-20130426/8750_1 /ASSEMBLY_ACC=CAM_ASM_000622 /TAXON_ID=183588 /ORGANISM="Pseudo-nitzschia fraudulenta, Strain WWA7" /LENGTH=418 /DNA_ID=CAMNT_0047390713 /DNA_START=92 /DNA_END=1348 /DNA_ORIENTATION=-
MKFHTANILSATAFVAASLSQNIVSANTPDLCTKDINDLLLLKPSECDPTGRVGPDILVGSTVYTNDEAHFVIGSPKLAGAMPPKPKSGKSHKRERRATRKLGKGTKKGSKGAPKLMVYLPGTTDWPALSSCLLQSVASVGVPTIGLTYGYLSRGDGFRNTRCGSLGTTELKVECLTEQHNDAIYGGTYGAERDYNGAEFWKPVDARDSIAGRLGLLLAKLDETNPEDGWGAYYKAAKGSYPASLPVPKWSKIAFMGHSQGAGHAAYLAQTKKTAGAVMISGPQDECLDCPSGTKFWIDEDFTTSAVTAFAHGDATETFLEPTLPIMKDNWSRMASSGTVSFSYPLNVVDTADYGSYDVCETPIVSSIAPSTMSPCGRKGHCATALDDSAPTLEDTSGNNVYVFALDIWSSVADVHKC